MRRRAEEREQRLEERRQRLEERDLRPRHGPPRGVRPPMHSAMREHMKSLSREERSELRDQLRELSPRERREVMRERFQNMPKEERRRLRKRFDEMGPEQRKQLRDRQQAPDRPGGLPTADPHLRRRTIPATTQHFCAEQFQAALPMQLLNHSSPDTIPVIVLS